MDGDFEQVFLLFKGVVAYYNCEKQEKMPK